MKPKDRHRRRPSQSKVYTHNPGPENGEYEDWSKHPRSINKRRSIWEESEDQHGEEETQMQTQTDEGTKEESSGSKDGRPAKKSKGEGQDTQNPYLTVKGDINWEEILSSEEEKQSAVGKQNKERRPTGKRKRLLRVTVPSRTRMKKKNTTSSYRMRGRQ